MAGRPQAVGEAAGVSANALDQWIKFNNTAPTQVCVGVAVSAAASPSGTVTMKLGAATLAPGQAGFNMWVVRIRRSDSGSFITGSCMLFMKSW